MKILPFIFTIILSFNFANAQPYKQISPGINYKHIIDNQTPLSMHLVKIDTQKTKLSIEKATGKYDLTREEVKSIAKRTNAIVAINGSNYRRGGRFNGNAVNLLKLNNEIYSDPKHPRGTLGISLNGKTLLINKIELDWNLKINDKVFNIDRINQPRGKGETVVYTKKFNKTTLTNNRGYEIIVKNNQITEINENGNSAIPKNGFVISFDRKANININQLQTGHAATLSYALQVLDNSSDEALETWKNFPSILGGATHLIHNKTILNKKNFHEELQTGKQIIHTNDERVADFHQDQERTWLIEKRHPRTAVGILESGEYLFVVVDGRNKEKSVGMTMLELAEFMLQQGCVDALNIGGGGCSTLVINGKVINDTSGSENGESEQRPVSEAILVTQSL